MGNAPTSVPEIIRNLNPVTEQFDSVAADSRRIQAASAAQNQNDPNILHQILTKVEQAICDMATD